MSDNWQHRSAGMKCKTCMWFVPKAKSLEAQEEEARMRKLYPSMFTTEATVLGRCRRHAPTMSGFPAVFSGDWCGDHKLDENSVG